MQVAMETETDMVVKRLSVPIGLEELMESLTKEVLRRKPSDIYAFASEHFAQLLEIRDQGNIRGSVKKSNRNYLYSSRDNQDITIGENNPIKVKAATFGAMTKTTNKTTIRNKSPAPKSFISKRNVSVTKVVPRPQNNNNKTNKQDRNKLILEKRRVNKKCVDDVKKKLESEGQPTELESKRIGDVSKRLDIAKRRQSMAQKKNEEKVGEGKTRSQSTSKSKQEDASKSTTERLRRKSDLFKGTKKGNDITNTEKADELKTQKLTTSEKISPRNKEGKGSSSKDSKKFMRIPSKIEMSDEVVTQMGRQNLEMNDTNSIILDESKCEKQPLLKAGNLNSAKKTISADKVLNQVGSPSTTNRELGKESLNIDIDGSEKNTEEKFASVTVEVFNGEDIKEQESSNVGAISHKSNLDKNLLQADYNENSLQSSAKELVVEKESEQIECQDLVPITKDKRQSGDNVNKPQLYFNIPDAITAVVKIQSLVRGYIVRKAISKQKFNFSRVQEKIDENINNIPLQREKLDDKKLTVQEEVVMNRNNIFDNDLNELDNIEQQTDKREKAAIKIQSFVRGHLSRKKLNEKKIEGMKDDEQISLCTEKKEEAKEEDSEANKCIHVENVNLEHFIDHIKAIVKMQALVRGYLLRKSIRIKKETINIATPDIENYVLGNNKPDVNLNLSTNAFELKRENSKETLNLINDQELKIELDKGDWKNLNSKEANAIIKIQAVVRGFLTRKFIASKKGMISGAENSADRNEILKQSKKMGIESAVTILQAFTRGYLVRKTVKKRSGEKCVTENVCFPVLLEHDLDVDSTKIASQQVEMLSVGNNNGASINEVLIENDSSICPKIDKVTKDATANFIGQEHIHYDSSRYDRPLASVINEKSSEVVEDISGSKQNSEETELHDVEEAEQVQDGSKEKLVKFDTNEAFGDDIKPRANSIEKISNAPNYVNDAATKIQSAWRSHRVRGGVNSLTLENLQAPLECDELPHQRGISEDAKKAAVIIQALFRGYMARKRNENTEHRSLKMRGFEGSLPTLLEVEGEDNKYSTSSSDHEKIEEYSGVLSNLEGRQSSKSDTSVSERSRTISDEVLADLKQLEDMPVPTEEPRKKSKTYTRSLTFDDPSIQQGSNLLTKSSTFIIGDEFQKFDSIDSEYPSLRSVEIDEESICTESESKLIEEAKDISEITTSIKQDVQKLKETLENGVEVKKVFENKPDDENITEITKSISEQVKQLEKALNQDTDIKSDGDYIEDKTDGTSELTEFLTRPVSKDSVTSTDSFDTVIFNDIHTRGLLLNFESSSAGGQNDLAHLNAIREQGDILVNDVLHTAKNKLQERDIETQIFEQEPVCQLTTDKRQSTTSDELRQLWQDEAATTIQKNYRGYRVRRDLGKQQNTSVNAAENEKRADYEITRYLNQITEPVRRAFLADTGLVNASGNVQSKERLDSVAAKVSPDVVYIPLRDYSSEEKEEEIVKTSTEDIQNLEANNNDEVIRDEEIIKKKEQQSSLLNPNEISGENQRTELLPTSIDEIDKEVDDKISACISSIVEPLTKRFQPVDSTDEKEEVEVSVEESEPVYEYIPLRNYSDDENKENESLPFLNDDITTTMSILKEDLETNEEEELDANEVFEEIDGRIQNNLNKLIYEKLRDEPNISNEILHEHSAVQDVVREGSTDVGKGTSEVITKQVSIHPTGYGSKEISEYIDSIIEPSKKAPLSKREPQSISDQEESVSKQDYKSKESNEEEEKLLKDEKSVNILENAVKHEIIPKDEVASIMSGKEEEKMNANYEEENDSVTVLKYNKGKMQAIGPDVLDSSVLKSTQKDAHNIIKDVIQMQNTVSNLDTKLHSGTLTTLENIPNLEDTVVKENVELIGKLPKLSDEVKKESVLFADKTLENVELVRDESSSLSYPIKEENEVEEDVEAVKFIEDNKAVFPEDKFEVCKTMQEKIIEDMIDSLDQTSDALTEVSDTYEVLNNDNHVNESRHTIENIKAFESDTSHNNNSEIIQARTTPIKQSQSDTSNTSESEITLELTSSVLPKDKIQDSIEPDQLTAIDDNFNFELSNSASDSTDNILDVIRVEIKDKLHSEESNTGYQKLTDVENVKENYNEVTTISLPVHSLPLGSDRKQYDLRDDNINEETIVHKQIENEDTTSDLQKENNTEIISKQTESGETENIEQKQIPKVSIIKENSDDNEGLERSIDKIENYNTELQVEREHSSTYLKAPGDVEADEGESNSFATLSYTGLSSPEHQSKQEMDLEDQELQSKMKIIESEIEDVLGRISSVDLNKKDNNDDENVRHSQATEFVESKSLPTNLDVLSEDIIVKNDIDMLDEEFDKRSKEKLIDDEVIETDIKIGVSDVDADQMHAVANNNVLRDSEEDVKDVKSADCKVDGEIIKLNENIDRKERNIDESRSQVESLPKTSTPPNKIREVSNIIIKDTRGNGMSTCRNSNHHGDVQVNTMFSAKIEDDSNGNLGQKNAARNEITDEHQTDDIDIKQADTEQSNKDTEYDIQTTDAIETGEQADSGPSTKAVENNTQTNDATVDVEQASNDVKYDTQTTDLPENIKQAEDKNKDIEDGTQAIDVNENRKQLDTEQLNKDMEYDIQEGDANKNIHQPDTEQTNNIKDDIQTTDIINEMKQTDTEQSNKDGEDRSQVTDTSETRKQVNVEDSNKDEQNIHATDATETQKQGDSKQSSEDIEFDIQATDANKSGKQAHTKHSNKDVEYDNQASDSTKNIEQAYIEQSSKSVENNMEATDAIENRKPEDSEQSNKVVKYDLQAINLTEEIKQADAEQSNKDGNVDFQGTDTTENRKQVHVELSSKYVEDTHATDATETIKQGDSNQSTEVIPFGIQITDANKSENQADTEHSNKAIEYHIEANGASKDTEQADAKQSKETVEKNMQTTDATENRKPEESVQTNEYVIDGIHAIGITKEIKQADAEQSNIDGEGNKSKKQANTEHSNNDIEYHIQASDATKNIKQADTEESNKGIENNIQTTDVNENRKPVDGEQSNEAVKHALQAINVTEEIKQKDAVQSNKDEEDDTRVTDTTESGKEVDVDHSSKDEDCDTKASDVTENIKQAHVADSSKDVEDTHATDATETRKQEDSKQSSEVIEFDIKTTDANNSETQAGTEQSNKDIEYHIQASDATKSIEQVDTEESNKSIENHIHATDTNENRMPEDNEQSNGVIKHDLQAINVTEKIKQKDAVQSNKHEEDDTQVTDATESRKQVDFEHSSEQDKEWDTEATDVTENIKQADVDDSNKDVEDTHATNSTEIRKQGDSKQSSEVVEFDIQTTDANNSEIQAGTEHSNKDVECYIQASDATKNIEQADAEQSKETAEKNMQTIDVTKNRKPEDSEQSSEDVKVDTQAIDVTKEIKQADAEQSNKDGEDDSQVTDTTESRKQVDIEHLSEQEKEWNTEATDVTENIKQADVGDSSKDVEDTHATNSTEIRKQGDSKQSSEIVEFAIQTTNVNKSENQADTEHSNKDVEYHVEARDVTKNIQQTDTEELNKGVENNMQPTDEIEYKKQEDSEQLNKVVGYGAQTTDVTGNLKQADTEYSNKDIEDTQATHTTENGKVENAEQPSKDGQYEIQPTVVNKAGERADVESSNQDVEYHTEPSDVGNNIQQVDTEKLNKDVQTGHTTDATEDKKQEDSQQSSKYAECDTQADDANKTVKQTDTEHSSKDVEYNMAASGVIEDTKQVGIEQSSKDVRYDTQTTDVIENINQEDIEHLNKDVEGTQAADATHNIKQTDTEQLSNASEYDTITTSATEAIKQTNIEQSNEDADNDIQATDTAKNGKHEDNEQSNNGEECNTQTTDINKTIEQADTEVSNKDMEYNPEENVVTEDTKQVGIEQSSNDVRYDTQTTDVIENIKQEDIEHLNKDVEGTQAADATDNIKQTDTEQLSNASEYDTITTSATEAIKQTNIEQSNEDAHNEIQATDTAKNGKHEDNEQSNNGEECNTQTTDINKTIEQADTEVSNKDMEYNPEENVVTEDTKQVGIEQSSKDVGDDTQTSNAAENIKQADPEYSSKHIEYDTQTTDVNKIRKQADTECSKGVEYHVQASDIIHNIQQSDAKQSNEVAEDGTRAGDATNDIKRINVEQLNNGVEGDTQAIDATKNIKETDAEHSNKHVECDIQLTNAIENIKQIDPVQLNENVEDDIQAGTEQTQHQQSIADLNKVDKCREENYMVQEPPVLQTTSITGVEPKANEDFKDEKQSEQGTKQGPAILRKDEKLDVINKVSIINSALKHSTLLSTEKGIQDSESCPTNYTDIRITQDTPKLDVETDKHSDDRNDQVINAGDNINEDGQVAIHKKMEGSDHNLQSIKEENHELRETTSNNELVPLDGVSKNETHSQKMSLDEQQQNTEDTNKIFDTSYSSNLKEPDIHNTDSMHNNLKENLLFKQEEDEQESSMQQTDFQTTQNKINEEKAEEVVSKSGDLEQLADTKHASPFYLNQDSFNEDASSAAQEKKFSEALKINGYSTKQNDSVTTGERLLHSSEFHDSIPISVVTQTPPKTLLTQTNGVQCDIERERSIPASTVLVHSGELHDNILPLALQMNQDPGIEIVTSPNKQQTSVVGLADAQASNKDVSARLRSLERARAQSESDGYLSSMDTEKRNNSTLVKKNMESEAATKIQASFRGYQVRKQLKNKLARDNMKRTARRRSLGRITETKSANKQPSDLEEQSATKIQAGIRGFLVRRRQKKNKAE